jgi:hypothetical protein
VDELVGRDHERGVLVAAVRGPSLLNDLHGLGLEHAPQQVNR